MQCVLDTDGKLYIWAGNNITGSPDYNDMNVYDTSSTTWTSLGNSSAPQPRDDFTATMLPDRRIIYIGGVFQQLGQEPIDRRVI